MQVLAGGPWRLCSPLRSAGQIGPGLLLVVQAALGLRVLLRLVRMARGRRIVSVDRWPAADGSVSVLLPVLNERTRLGPCLEGLRSQGAELHEIVVIDGGSADGTVELVRAWQEREHRLRLVDASVIPPGWNGKAWGLQVGLDRAALTTTWVLTMDADVRPKPGLIASLVAHAERSGLGVVSVATTQELAGPGSALVHPALLATLVYRFGIPGQVARRVEDVQANGQCLLIRRDLLATIGGFEAGRLSLCDDVTVARQLAVTGCPSGFFEAPGLVSVRMYESGWETFVNWSRSLPLRDHLSNARALLGLAEVTLVQALPLLVLTTVRPDGVGSVGRWLRAVNLGLLVLRLGMLAGTRRAYCRAPWTYWLSPLLDLPVTLMLWRSALTRRHRWRGREVLSGGVSGDVSGVISGAVA
jgi:dolichol-phosphate mannosyltransferase